MREDEELIEEARRSVEETQQLREESGLGSDTEPGAPPNEVPPPTDDD